MPELSWSRTPSCCLRTAWCEKTPRIFWWPEVVSVEKENGEFFLSGVKLLCPTSTVAPNCPGGHYILHRHALKANEIQFHLQLSLLKKKRVILLSPSSWVHIFFNNPCEEMGSTHKALRLHSKIWWMSREKTFVQSSELRAELAAFFVKHHFCLKEPLTDKF